MTSLLFFAGIPAGWLGQSVTFLVTVLQDSRTSGKKDCERIATGYPEWGRNPYPVYKQIVPSRSFLGYTFVRKSNVSHLNEEENIQS